LCTLIHKELTIANHQWIESKNKAAMKDCQNKLMKLLNQTMHDEGFKEYLVQDIMTRGKNTLKAIRDDSSEEKAGKVLLSLKVMNLNTLLNVDDGPEIALLDPLALNFLFKTLLKSNKFKLNENP